MCNSIKQIKIMKTIAKKNYITPNMELVLVRNQQALLTGSNTNVDINDRVPGGYIGDPDD